MDLDEQLVGMESRTNRVIEMLHIQPETKDVRMIGIWGMGGLGKTTLAKKVYNQIMENFPSKCFLENVRNTTSQTNGVVELQKQLVRQLDPSQKNVHIDHTDRGIIEIQRIVGNKRVLIVLDDVDDQDKQLRYLARKPEWFGHGSCVLITTRDRIVLDRHKIQEDMIVAASSLDESESLQLFCRHAFDRDEPPTEYKDLSQRIMSKLGGHPLAIKVVACDLFLNAQSIKEWEKMARREKFDPDQEVENCLKISYDKLNENEKSMFLDIACLLIGYDVREATYMWDACGYCSERGLKRLMNKCLVQVDKYGKLQMHDLLRDMGRSTVESESKRTGELQSRIWIEDKAEEMLKNNKGISKVEGLRYFSSGTTLIPDNENFDKWSNLRLLFFHKEQHHLPSGLNLLSSKLKWLEWEDEREDEFPAPDEMDLSEVAVLKFCKTTLTKVWDESHLQMNLRVLDLSYCNNLTTSPDFSCSPKLVKLRLSYCQGLTTIHESICNLRELEYLDLDGCLRIKSLPPNIGNLKTLKFLLLFRTGVTKLASSLRHLTNMKVLYWVVTNNWVGEAEADDGLIESLLCMKGLCALQLNSFLLGPESTRVLIDSLQLFSSLRALSLLEDEPDECYMLYVSDVCSRCY